MAQRRHHAERAFESLLRARRIPYVAVNEARKALAPGPIPTVDGTLKSFDFIVYGRSTNLLIEVKGRTIPPGTPNRPGTRMDCWVTRQDLEALRAWQDLFGPGYEAVFVFMYACPGVPPDGIFGEVLEHQGDWYTVRAISLDDYQPRARVRSDRWGTVDLPRADFERLSRPFSHEPGLEASPALEIIG